jgi:serine/threonine protein kinase
VDGTPFGRYRLIELIGEGGMGEVWRAHDTVTDRVVAIKLLPPKLSKDEDFQQRFRREALAAARLETPHVVPIHDYGEIDGRLFVCMRLIKGRDLATVLAHGPLEPARAARIIGQVAEALHAAHEIGLIHRDIKPSNILLDDRNFAYLIDFGIARAAEDTRMTKTGNTIGTFAYIAPERLDGRGDEDARVDIYSLACVLYECLAGEPPFGGDTMARLVAAHLNTPPPRPSIGRPDVPAQVDEVIATGMAKDPEQRYATTVELADAAHDAITTPIGLPARNLATREDFAADPGATISAARQQDADLNLAETQQPSDPKLPAPLLGLSTGDQKSRRRRRIVLAGGAAAIGITVVLVLVIVFTNGSGHANRPSAGSISTAPANTGPFTGVYRADFGPSATHGKPDDGGTPSSGQWAVRSVCRSTGCVATATVAGGPTLQSAVVFDDIGGQWRAVSAGSVASFPPGVSGFAGCIPGEYWTVITLQIRPDGTLAGQYRATGPPDCETERTVTFTRIGDVDLNTLPDPAGQPVRVPSPAEAWHGRYHGTHTAVNANKQPMSWDTSVETDCLRTGERCISSGQGDSEGSHSYIFAGGQWTYSFEGTSNCINRGSKVGTIQTKIYWELPLPQPPQHPITLLTGHGHRDATGGGSCAGSYDEEVKFERTGD